MYERIAKGIAKGGVFEAIAKLKDELSLNVTLASPDDFIPAPPAWQDLAMPIEQIGEISFFHYDLCMQALAKIERGFSQDLADARGLVEKGFVSTETLRERFAQIEGTLSIFLINAIEGSSSISLKAPQPTAALRKTQLA